MAYDENSIKTLDWREHIRMRPGMYIGKLGDGASPDDGIYVLLKEVIDNSIDEFVMGFGKKITIDVTPDGLCEVRDFGRGIPLGKLLDCAAKINTGAKYDSDAFKKSVGLNGVGIKAVNALSDFFEIQAYRDGETRSYQFCRGKEIPKGRKDGAVRGHRIHLWRQPYHRSLFRGVGPTRLQRFQPDHAALCTRFVPLRQEICT